MLPGQGCGCAGGETRTHTGLSPRLAGPPRLPVPPRRHSLIRSSGHWHTRRGPRQTPPKPRWHGNTHFRGTGNPSHAGMCKKTRVMFAAVHSLLLNVSQQWRRSSHRARRKGRGVQEPHPPYRLLRRHRHWCHRSGIGNTGARTVLGPGNLRLVPTVQRKLFGPADVLLTSAVLGGASDALHQLVSVFTNFMESAAV